jgi:putative colanic acid biosynthesis acetyltransferase WcaF
MSVTQNSRIGPSYNLTYRLARAVWLIAWLLLARWTPPPLHAWRSFLLRCFGAKVGQGVHVYSGVKVWAPWNLEIGDQTGIGNGATLYAQGKINLGKRVVISQGAHLCGGTHDYTLKGFPVIPGDITIEDDVWIAAEAFVHPGLRIQEGAILGARAVAVKDLEAWTIYAGNPAKKIKTRRLSEKQS